MCFSFLSSLGIVPKPLKNKKKKQTNRLQSISLGECGGRGGGGKGRGETENVDGKDGLGGAYDTNVINMI